ncbi:MAG: OsmC family protein [Chloroflexi bacterium]|nr:OsmC family protein [Chloroflexota bacterium]
MDAKVIWQGKELNFTGTAERGHTLLLSGSPEDGSPPPGFAPFELIAVGLAGCTAMDVISILKKKRQDVTNFEVRVHGERASEHPKVFTHLWIEYVVTGHNLEREAVERSVQLSVEKYCGVHAMLEKNSPIEHKITIQEA